MGVVEPINPDICQCSHMKEEHGGRLTGLFKSLPGTGALVAKLAQDRVITPNMPRPKKVYACLICSCNQFKGMGTDND